MGGYICDLSSMATYSVDNTVLIQADLLHLLTDADVIPRIEKSMP